jgi:predicted amidohydrolase
VDGTLRRYERHVAAAASAGAELIVLPEVAVRGDARSRHQWIAGVSAWARAHRIAIVAPYFDQSRPVNELVVLGREGQELVGYEKQHPAPIEPPRRQRMPPGVARLDGPSPVMVSTVICVDLDYNDLAPHVRRTGGLLAAPSNDWPVFEALHHRTAVWAAVMSGTSLIRATGHGTSAAYDPAGYVLAHQSSLEGPVVLIADLPL